MKYRLFLILSCLLCTLAALSAQERSEKTYSIFFRVGKSDVDRTYLGNDQTLETMINDVKVAIDENGSILDSLTVYATTSPEGSVALNEFLAQKRASATKDCILSSIPELSKVGIKIESRPNDWTALSNAVEDDDTILYRDQILKVLNDPNIANKEAALRKMPHVFAVIRDRLFNQMRTATVVIKVVTKKEIPNPELTITCESPLKFSKEGGTQIITYQTTAADSSLPAAECTADWIDSVVTAPEGIYVVAKANGTTEERNASVLVQYYGKTHEVALVQEAAPLVVEESVVNVEPQLERKPFYMNIRTNLLYDALIIPNIGAEFYLGKSISVIGNWMYSWWKKDPKAWYWRTYGGDLGVRYWFGKAAKEKHLTGHHVGIYGQILTYDFELGKRGYLGDRWTFGGGVEYGYSLPVARRLNIDFNLGVGYIGGEFKEYLPIDGHYVWQSTKYRQWFGPTKAEISLVWQLGRGNENKGKGGKR